MGFSLITEAKKEIRAVGIKQALSLYCNSAEIKPVLRQLRVTLWASASVLL